MSCMDSSESPDMAFEPEMTTGQKLDHTLQAYGRLEISAAKKIHRIRELEAAIAEHRDATHRPGFLSTGPKIEEINAKLWAVTSS